MRADGWEDDGLCLRPSSTAIGPAAYGYRRQTRQDIAEHGAKDDRVFSLAAQVTAAGRTAAMSIDEGRHLSFDDMLLQAPLQGFALADRQANESIRNRGRLVAWAGEGG